MRLISILVILCILAVPAGAVGAIQQRSQCMVAAGETISGNFYTACADLVIDGTVQGDVVAIAGTVTVNGTVNGDLVLIAGQAVINGKIGGDVRSIAARLEIQPGAQLTADAADVTALGLNAHIGANVPGDVLFAGYQTIIDGTVGGNLRFSGSALRINGSVTGDADVTVGGRNAFHPPDIAGLSFITPGMALNAPDEGSPSIRGNLKLETPDLLNVPMGAVGGSVMLQSSPQIGSSFAGEILSGYLWRVLHDLLALMLIGLVMLLVMQPWLQFNTHRLKVQPAESFGYGLATFVLSVPAALLLIFVSAIIIGVVSLLTLGELTLISTVLLATVNIALFAGFWFIVMFPARIIVCYVIGQWIGRRVFPEADRVTSIIISFLVGVVAYTLITDLPIGILGVLLNIGLLSFGVGAIVLFVRDLFVAQRLAGVPHIMPVDLRPALPASRATPIMPPEDSQALPGMDNLPEGFTWFDN
jgi:cytoskeletal protein CcmA (bactofilin family)